MDHGAVGLRPAHESALHAQDETDDVRRPRRVRRAVPADASARQAPRDVGPSRRRRQRRDARRRRETTSGRCRSYEYDELVARDKCSLDLLWLRDESLEDSANLTTSCLRRVDRNSLGAPHVVAQRDLGDSELARNGWGGLLLGRDLDRRDYSGQTPLAVGPGCRSPGRTPTACPIVTSSQGDCVSFPGPEALVYRVAQQAGVGQPVGLLRE